MIIQDCNEQVLFSRMTSGIFVFLHPGFNQTAAEDAEDQQQAIVAAVQDSIQRHLPSAVSCALRHGTYNVTTGTCLDTADQPAQPPYPEGTGAYVGLDANGNLVLKPKAVAGALTVVRVPTRLEVDGGVREVDELRAQVAGLLPACEVGATLRMGADGWTCA